MPKKAVQNYLWITIFYLCVGQLWSQNSQLYIHKLGLKNGLSSYNIHQIYQDKEGLIWLATDYGLNRYDGVNFEVYTKEEDRLCGNDTRSVYEDVHGNLWIYAKDDNGTCICVLDKKKDEIIPASSYVKKGKSIDWTKVSLLGSPSNQLLFASEDWMQKKFKYFEYDGDSVQFLFDSETWQNKEHNLGFGLIYKINAAEYAVFELVNPPLYSALLVVDRKGKLLRRLSCPKLFPTLNWRALYPDGFASECSSTNQSIRALQLYLESSLGKFTFKLSAMPVERYGLWKDRLYMLNSDSMTIYSLDKGKRLAQMPFGYPLDNEESHLFIDNAGNVWTRNDKELLCISSQALFFETYLSNGRTFKNKIRGISQDLKGNIYAVGIGFVWQLDKKGNWQQLPIDSPDFNSNFLGILPSDNGLWLGNEGGNLVYWDNRTETKKFFYVPEGYNGDLPEITWTVYKTTKEQLLLGTSNGVFRLDTLKKVLLPVFMEGKGSLSTSTVYHFYENKAGTWLASSSGLYLVDIEQRRVLEHYSSDGKETDFIPGKHIAHFIEDQEGTFWLATKGDGLIKWNPRTKEHKQFTQKGAGLSHNVLYAVYADTFRNLWIASQRGLMRFDKETQNVTIYQEQDGLPHNEFNTIAHYKGADGKLYFGGQNGFIQFSPEKVQQQATHISQLLITKATKLQHKSDTNINILYEVKTEGQVKISPQDKSFRISFALLDYYNSNSHQYSYRIDGYDKDWVFLDGNTIVLNNLPYGRYKLYLRAKSAQCGRWINYENPIAVRVLRPFYLQGWFIALVVFCLAASVYLFFLWRIRVLSQRKEELEVIVLERTAKIKEDNEIILKQADELKELDTLKSKFFANISHELRTPLTLILGPLSYILDDEKAWEKDSVRQQLLTMQRNGKSLLSLIEEILDLSKLEVNKLELLLEPTPLKHFFELILARFEPQIQAQKLDFSSELALESDLCILLDRKKLEKIINNFLSNAIKFTPSEGRIALKVKVKDNRLYLQVKDSGKGIHPEDLPRVFERFYQSKQADQKLYGGTGIGLALVKEFAELMGGNTYVESQPHEGSTFFFEMPFERVLSTEFSAFDLKEEAEGEEIDLTESIGTDFSILVVEDNPDMQNFVTEVLAGKYKEVLLANNGVEGLNMLKDRAATIDLIISDVMMPEMDGLTMLQHIKSNPLWARIPVVMLTALTSEKDKLKALTIGVDDYLTKPFSVSELLARVQNLLYNYQQRQSVKALEGEEKEEEAEDDISTDVLDADHIEWVKSVEALVQLSLDDELITIDDLAAKMFLSKRQFSRKLKEFTGFTPAKFIREVQLQKARTILEAGGYLSISEIAFQCRFENHTTFSLLFKKRFGKSPSAYS